MKKILPVAIVCILLFCFSSFAAERIQTRVTVSVTYKDAGEGALANALVNVSGGTITDMTSSIPEEKRKPGDKVTVTATIVPNNGYIFSSSKKNTTMLYQGNNVSLISKKINGTSSMTAKFSFVAAYHLGRPANLYVDGSYVAHWDKVPYTSTYEVKIISGTRSKTVTVNTNKVDLATYATTEEGITFAVRAAGNGKYTYSSEWASYGDSVIEEDNSVLGSWEGSSPPRMRFLLYSDGEKVYATGWQYLGKRWYYFDKVSPNYMKTGWLLDGGKWYYLDPGTGEMQTGWILVDGKWYHLMPNGSMEAGKWIQTAPASAWYYLYPDGHMACSERTPDGYYVDGSGAWVPGK